MLDKRALHASRSARTKQNARLVLRSRKTPAKLRGAEAFARLWRVRLRSLRCEPVRIYYLLVQEALVQRLFSMFTDCYLQMNRQRMQLRSELREALRRDRPERSVEPDRTGEAVPRVSRGGGLGVSVRVGWRGRASNNARRGGALVSEASNAPRQVPRARHRAGVHFIAFEGRSAYSHFLSTSIEYSPDSLLTWHKI